MLNTFLLGAAWRGLITFLAALLELSRRNLLHIAVDNSLKLIGGEFERTGQPAGKNLFRCNCAQSNHRERKQILDQPLPVTISQQ